MSNARLVTKNFKGIAMLAVATIAINSDLAHAQYGSSPYSAPYKPTPAIAQTQAPAQAPKASIADVVERVTPAVVNIVVTSQTGEVTTQGQGSGFIISPAGEVVTNYHVIEDGQNISVIFKNGATFEARIVGTDEETDLAVLKIDSPQPFPNVPFYQGQSPRIGDWVIAIGNPYGIGQSTSLGIISAIGRERVESGAYVDYIQTDATINTGNSGGPLFNPQGQVIGVNSAIYSPTGASVGIGFSIPHYTAVEVVDAILRDGYVRRGYLGAALRTAEYSFGEAAPHARGAIVNNVVQGGPAAQHGLRVDDIILQMNGQTVENSVEATRAIARFSPGQTVNLLIERDEEKQTIPVRIAERPSKDKVEQALRTGQYASAAPVIAQPSQPAPSRPSAPSTGGAPISTGMSLVDLSATFRRNIGMRADQTGVYVERVSAGSAAQRGGVEANMVLLEANQKPITSVSGFHDIYRNAKRAGMSSIRLRVRQIQGAETYLTLPI